MSAEHGGWKPLGRLGLGPNTLRRLVGGSLGNSKIPDIMESLVGLGPSLGTLVSGLSSLEGKPDEEETQR